MNLIIRDMEMPDNCEKCPFLDYEQGFCFASGKKGKDGWYESSLYSGSPDFTITRNPKCPLAEVPTPHGRLIDADAFLATIRPCLANDDYQACTFSTVKKLLIEHIAAAPTVIEAEEV